ncbi:MAG: polyprenyl synthetase family protein [Nitrospirae bacterium]|nr:polyprenyl synthetase family protein [Nitrospirota bacterium]
MDIETYLKEKRELIDSFLKSYFTIPTEPTILHEAIKYSLFAGGKRIRPILALTSYEACGGEPKDILPHASALELIHTYSLIHDDLPSMDNDDLRRGKPTSHKIFGEAIAILAGDALLTEAFLMLSNMEVQSLKFKVQNEKFKMQKCENSFPYISHHVSRITYDTILRVIHEVALAAGVHGMVAGQAMDISSDNSKPDKDILNFIHLHKTAALITASVRMGGILSNIEEKKLKALTEYGKKIGLAFQIVDDILDIEGSAEVLGKKTGSDIKMNKMTYPALYGIEESRQEANDLISDAIDSLQIFYSDADYLRKIALYILKRRV